MAWDPDSWTSLPLWALCPRGPGNHQAHLGIRRWKCSSLCFHCCLHVYPALNLAAGWWWNAHNRLNVSEIQGICRNGILWSISSETGLNVARRNQSSPTPWSQEEAWCEGALVLVQGLGMQLWQDPLGGELQITWHTLVATGAVKETVFWTDYSFVLCKHTTK